MSISRSKQFVAAIPPSKISALSSGEFVGMVADDPDNKIDLKAFHCEIFNNHNALKIEEEGYAPIPSIRRIDNKDIQLNYVQIKIDIQKMIHSEIEQLLNDPSLKHLIIRKN